MDKQKCMDAFVTISLLEDTIHNKLGAIGYAFDSLNIDGVTENGVSIGTQYTHCGGCGTDYDDFSFTWDELEMDNETYEAHHKEQEAIRKAQKEAEEQARKELDALNAKKAKEEKDRREYERLRAKFEGA